MNQFQLPSNQKGLSLVELMVAMVLGIVVLGGTLSIFSTTMESTRLNQALTQIQANSRFASEIISNDLKMAGYFGCASSSTGSLIITADNPPTNNFANSALHGAVVAPADWVPGRPNGYTAPVGVGAPVVGTHALMVQYAVPPGNRLSNSMSSRSAAIDLVNHNEDIAQSDFAVISNCNNGELFSISTTGTVPNGMTVSPDSSLSQAYLQNALVPESVRVMPFKSAMYYVGNTGRVNSSGNAISSLYLQTFPYDLNTNPPLELIEGVEHLQLSFGVANEGSYQFHAPDSATLDYADVVMVKVGLLFSTNESFHQSSMNRSYYLADTLVTVTGGGGALTYADDKRVRLAQNLSVRIRNRN